MDARNILRLGRLRQRFENYMLVALKGAGYDGLAPAHGSIVAMLNAKGPLTMSDLALWVEKRKPTVTVLVNKLQKHALVKCEKDRYDQRVTRVYLTEEGKAFANTTNQLAKQVLSQAVKNVPVPKLDVFTEVLEELLRNLEDYR